MLKEEMLENYGYLNRLAESKCRSRADAEDLVSETMLAAFAYLKRGGINLSSEEDFEEEFMRSQEAAELRRELLRLSKTYCEVLIRPNSETILSVACHMCYHLYTKARRACSFILVREYILHRNDKKGV